MTLWGIILIAAAAAVFFFICVPVLPIFFAVFYRKKAIPFEQYNLKKFQNHYYIPYLGKIAGIRGQLKAKTHAEVYAVSRDKLRLYGEYYDQNSPRTAIVFHGIGAEMYTNTAAHAWFLYRCGFNVLMVCHRAHGKSGGHWTTIGIREQYDVLTWVRFAEQRGAENILLYGVSMGGAAVAYASDKLKDTKVRAMVIDSGYYSIYEQMKRDVRKNHIPKIMLPAMLVSARLFLRVNIKQPVTESLRHSTTPAFFLHGTDDETVEPRWCTVNYDACTAPKELLTAEDAPHTLSILKQPELTEKRLQRFFDRWL